MKAGEKVLWRCRPGVAVPAVLAEIKGAQVKIRVNKQDGTRIERWVPADCVKSAEVLNW